MTSAEADRRLWLLEQRVEALLALMRQLQILLIQQQEQVRGQRGQ